MTREWGILTLKEPTDTLNVAEIERDLRARWSQVVCRFPAVKQGQLDRDNPLSQYVFVQLPLSPKIERSVYASKLLRDPLTRKLQRVTDEELVQMAPLPTLPPPGTMVQITAGDYSGLYATVVEANCQTVRCLTELWSRKTLVTLAANEFVIA